MRIYISGPITGTTDYPERFDAAARRIEAAGHVPVNPVYMAKALPDGIFTEYMSLDLKLLEFSDGIYFLHGWRGSRGARSEWHKADSLHMPMWEEGDDLGQEGRRAAFCQKAKSDIHLYR